MLPAVVDVSGRPYCVHTGEPDGQIYVQIGDGPGPSFGGSLTRHVFETLAFHAQLGVDAPPAIPPRQPTEGEKR